MSKEASSVTLNFDTKLLPFRAASTQLHLVSAVELLGQKKKKEQKHKKIEGQLRHHLLHTKPAALASHNMAAQAERADRSPVNKISC